MATAQRLDLVFVRHGMTLWNQQHQYCGQSDVPCLPRAMDVYAPLKQMLNKYTWDGIFCSDLVRCRQTAKYLVSARNEQIQYTPLLRELHFGAWEGKTYADLQDDPVYMRWLEDPSTYAPPGGESMLALTGRLEQFYQMILEQAEAGQVGHVYHLIVTHAGVMRALLQRFVPERAFWEWDIPFGKAYHVCLDKGKGGWSCISWSVVPVQAKEHG